MMNRSYDAVLLVSFGGPEGMDDVIPFLQNVPRDRMLEAARHSERFGGVSPINAQNRTLIAAIEAELNAHDLKLPVYWGNATGTPSSKRPWGRWQGTVFDGRWRS